MVYTLRQGDRKTEGIFFKHTVFDYMTTSQSDRERIPLLFQLLRLEVLSASIWTSGIGEACLSKAEL